MTTTELKKKIRESENSEWFSSLNINLEFAIIEVKKSFKGLDSLHRFLNQQVKAWQKVSKPVNVEFKNSIEYFENSKELVERFVIDNVELSRDATQRNWTNAGWQESPYDIISKTRGIFVYDVEKTIFLMNVLNKTPSLFKGAFDFIVGEDIQHNLKNKIYLKGLLYAYEFEMKETSFLSQVKNEEKKTFDEFNNEMSVVISETEDELDNVINNAKAKFTERTDEFDKSKREKETNFNTWFKSATAEFNNFENRSRLKIDDLERAYAELLSLKEPATYWKKRAVNLKEQGWKAIYWLIGIVLFACLSLYFLLWLTPEGMLLSFINGDASAIKWSIVYITFITFLAFGIRAINKVAFSSFHLARDAEEREQLTFVYLALIKDNAVDKEDKNLIIQALFSRADTGLLKDDSSPTMPNDLSGKIFGK